MDVILSVVMLAAMALAGSAVLLWRRGARKQAGLMVVLVVVMLVNVLIWTIPSSDGATPIDRAAEMEDGR